MTTTVLPDEPIIDIGLAKLHDDGTVTSNLLANPANPTGVVDSIISDLRFEDGVYALHPNGVVVTKDSGEEIVFARDKRWEIQLTEKSTKERTLLGRLLLVGILLTGFACLCLMLT